MGEVLAGSAEGVQEVKQVVGLLAGGVEADEEVRRPVLPVGFLKIKCHRMSELSSGNRRGAPNQALQMQR